MGPSYALRVGTFNTHVSEALHQGALGWLLERAPAVSIWFLQEVRDVAHVRDALERAGVGDDWHVLPAGYAREGAFTYVLALKSRFAFEQPFAAIYRERLESPQYPRELVEARVLDRRTQRLVYLSSIHVDPLGKGFEDANKRARAAHEFQVQAYAERAGTHLEDEQVIYGGDLNEHLDTLRYLKGDLQHRHALARLRGAGMRPAFQLTQAGSRLVDLDDVFIRPRPHLAVRLRRLLRPPFPGVDHPAVIVRLSVRGA